MGVRVNYDMNGKINMNRVTLKESVEMVSCIKSNRVTQVIKLELEPVQKHGVTQNC